VPNSLVRKLEDYVQIRESELIESLQSFLRMKSISKHRNGRNSPLFTRNVDKIGIQTEMWSIEGAFPVVYGEILNPDACKTLFIYGHYDVQPPEPLELWDHDPFDPVIQDGKIMARGATDDKGNLWATIMAVKSLKDNGIPLPINLKFFFEGEEEVKPSL
jgi:acetylornithine deacetylase/succinyl-diaminopimelate desuccinylase-like protein